MTVVALTSTVSLAGQSLQSVEDIRQLLGYAAGLVVALIFAYTFWRTFGRRT